MAFFGVNTNLINCGTPSTSQTSESSDLTPYQAVAIAREVRMRGLVASQQSFYRLQIEYGQAYAAYQQLQADVSAKAAAIDTYFNGQEAAARAVCEKAAEARAEQIREGGSDLTHPKYQALVAGLSSDRRQAIDELLVPFYIIRNQLEEAENALWSKHAALQAAQEVYKLWAVELNAADMQLQTLPAEKTGASERNLSELKHLAQRVAEIRRKRILQRRKEKTVVRHMLKTEAADTPQTETRSIQDTQKRLSASSNSKTRVSSAPPSSNFCLTSRKDKREDKKADFDPNDWL